MDKILINLEENFCRKYFDKDIVTIDEVLDRMIELDEEVDQIKEAYRELEEDIKENYRPIPISEQVGVSERDFI